MEISEYSNVISGPMIVRSLSSQPRCNSIPLEMLFANVEDEIDPEESASVAAFRTRD